MASYGLPAWPWSDAQIDDLPAPERLLLDALRLWAREARRGAAPAPALHTLLATEDAVAAAPPIDALLCAVTRACGHLPALGCPLCPVLCPAEADLLLACALAQRGARGEALAALMRWLPPLPAYAAMPTAIHLGVALHRAGLVLRHPLRPDLTGR
jgi:hypothetical protein